MGNSSSNDRASKELVKEWRAKIDPIILKEVDEKMKEIKPLINTSSQFKRYYQLYPKYRSLDSNEKALSLISCIDELRVACLKS